MMIKDITQAKLKEIAHYDPPTGEFARYLASYLIENQEDFTELDRYGVITLDIEELARLIQTFQDTLP